MAILKSTEVTEFDASPGNKYNNVKELQSATWNYTTVGTESATDVITAVELVTGSQVVGYSLSAEDVGTGVTLDIGVTSGGQELAAGVDVSTAASVSDVFRGAIAGTTVYVEFVGAGPDADKDLSGVIYYI